MSTSSYTLLTPIDCLYVHFRLYSVHNFIHPGYCVHFRLYSVQIHHRHIRQFRLHNVYIHHWLMCPLQIVQCSFPPVVFVSIQAVQCSYSLPGYILGYVCVNFRLCSVHILRRVIRWAMFVSTVGCTMFIFVLK